MSKRLFGVLCLAAVFGASGLSKAPCASAQVAAAATLGGVVLDPSGALIPHAHLHLSVATAGGQAQAAETDAAGRFRFSLAPGTYVLQAEAEGFTPYTSAPVEVKAEGGTELRVKLDVQGRPEIINAGEDGRTSTNPADNQSALIFEGDRLRLLSDDNATLQMQLRGLAGPGFASGGTQFLINGMSGGALPPKSSIRSIRINQNPYSAYFDSLGFGRVEIQTQPGGEKLHGALNFTGTDQPFNANNPYTGAQPPYYQFQAEGNLSGSVSKRTSFFLAGDVQLLANNALVNAVDPANTFTTVSQPVAAPQRTDTDSLRLDHQFSSGHFGYLRDEWSQTHIRNSGITPLVLPEAAFSANTLTNLLQGSDTQVLGPHGVNEVRFQYLRTRVRQDPNSAAPSVMVEGSFQAGGSPAQLLRDAQDRYEVQDLLEFDRGGHSARAGFRFRELRDSNNSRAGFNGQYVFPDLNTYRITQAGLAAGQTPAQIRAAGGGASQLSVTAGQSSASLSTADLGAYAEDDWKAGKDLTLSYGLRFETQSAIPDHFDPAPRLGLAWLLRHGKEHVPVLTFRAGYGIFYDRFPAGSLLQAVRQNGTSELGYFVQNPDTYPNLPAPGTLAGTQPTIYRVNPALRSSYAQTGSASIDRTLGKLGTVSANWLYVHGTHNFLSRNVNAPLPGTYNPASPTSGTRPLGTAQNIYQYSSDGNENAEIFFLTSNLQLTKTLYFFATYVLQRDYNDAAGVGSFVSNSYNVGADYARQTGNQLQLLNTAAFLTLPRGFALTLFLLTHSGSPFDVTTGTDLNGDTIFNDRPSFASDMSRPSVVRTALGNFDTDPLATQRTIPRNYANAPAFFALDLQASRRFRVGPLSRAYEAADAKAGAPTTKRERPWELRFQVEAQNLTNHNNPGPPVGVLSSPYFGRSLSLVNGFSPLTASNRSILLQSFFTF